MHAGIDSPVDCGKYVAAIKAANLEFVGRYYRAASSAWPRLTASEAMLLSAAGIRLVALWESASTRASYFSHASGVHDSTTAYAQALDAGQPKDTPIYFAVDYDAGNTDISGNIADYFDGIAAGYAAIGKGVRSTRSACTAPVRRAAGC